MSGQWPFASGGPAPQWFTGNCVIFEGDAPRIGPSGMPESIMAVIPAGQLDFLDNWHVVGFKATDSCDVAARDVFVPERFTCDIFTATSCFDLPVCKLPIRSVLATGHAAVAIGIAQGALTTSRRWQRPSGRP